MGNSCSGKRVLVTAAGAGIGKGIASAFVEQGARVHICDVDADRLVDCRSEFAGRRHDGGGRQRPGAGRPALLRGAAHLGGLDVLVNNAGIAGPTGLTEELEPAEWDRTIAVNLNSQFYCAAARHSSAEEGGWRR